jgi:hypothetical protein
MSRFAVVYEDPSYEEPVVDDWADTLDGFVTVADSNDVLKYLNTELKDFDSSYSPFETINS